jgi:hypothetical protein
MARWQEELVEAVNAGDEARARGLLSQPGARGARSLLEVMLAHPDALVRQAAAFGLGEVGGTASARCLELRLPLEEARQDHDGSSVAEAITEALGRIAEAGTRATLVRRLQRLATGTPDPGDIGTVVHALWRGRHPDLLPVIRETLARFTPPAPRSLQGLLTLLEKSPEALGLWVQDRSTPVEHKTGVLTVLEADVSHEWVAVLPAFISTAHELLETAVKQRGEASYYCERLFSLLLLHKERLLPALPDEACAELRTLTRELVAATSLNCASRAAALLQHVGLPEDALHVEAHRPAEPILARVFDEAARALRGLQER